MTRSSQVHGVFFATFASSTDLEQVVTAVIANPHCFIDGGWSKFDLKNHLGASPFRPSLIREVYQFPIKKILASVKFATGYDHEDRCSWPWSFSPETARQDLLKSCQQALLGGGGGKDG